jgi:uncharacterized protein YodC (DUF2158 family)
MITIEQISVGTTVRLKHGGPQMTITQIYTDDTVDCSWFNNTLDFCTEKVQFEALDIIDGYTDLPVKEVEGVEDIEES